MKHREYFLWLALGCGFLISAFILVPLLNMLFAPSLHALGQTIQDKTVVKAIWLSIYTSGLAALIELAISEGTSILASFKSTAIHTF